MATAIRHEIRTISEEERTAFFAAMNIMKTFSLTEGTALYGTKFRTLDYLIRKHAAAVLDSECDQGHYGPAFLTFHEALLREYELSIMAIDERIQGLPYWNWFVDNDGYGDISESSMWSQYLGSYYGDPYRHY